MNNSQRADVGVLGYILQCLVEIIPRFMESLVSMSPPGTLQRVVIASIFKEVRNKRLAIHGCWVFTILFECNIDTRFCH